MKKFLKMLLATSLSALFLWAAIGCTPGTTDKDDPDPDPDPDKKISATVDFYTSVNIIEQQALQSVANAYMDMQYEKGNDIQIRIRNSTDPEAYTQTLRGLMTNGVKNPSIAQTSVISEYFGTNKILNMAGYLEEPNPYIEGNTAWMDALEEDAYRAQQVGSSSTIPSLSYSSSYTTVFYNKAAMLAVMGKDDPAVKDDGTLDDSKITWDWMLGALEKAKNSKLNFKNPLGLSTNAQSFGEDSFNMGAKIVNMYLDQYFRDFIEKAHSKQGDYSYIESVDKDWKYDEKDATLDLFGNYTYNINRVVDLYFNQTGYNPTSERYAEAMANLYDLFSYADQEAAYNDNFNRFNETTIVFEDKGGSYSDMKLFYVEDLAYVRTYRDAFKYNVGNKTVYPTASEISSELGWFLLPAMDSDLAGVADNVRPSGGPNENYGVLSTGEQSTDEIAVDFMKYLFSPKGQAGIFAKYQSENNAPVVMRQLVKGVAIPAEIDYTKVVVAEGDCTSSPYQIFGKGTGMKSLTIGSSGTYIKDEIGSALSKYFRGSDKDWSKQAGSYFNILKSGFSNYAKDSNFIYEDYAQVANKTNDLVNSPYNTVS